MEFLRKNTESKAGRVSDRSQFTTEDSVTYIWKTLGLPAEALTSLFIEGTGLGFPSSFKVGHVAQASIALSALSAALVHSVRSSSHVPKVTVPLQHSMIEFKSEAFYLLNDQPPLPPEDAIGGLHRTLDGYVRIHDGFPNHRNGTRALLGLSPTSTREDVAREALKWKALDLEIRAVEQNIVITSLRSYSEWDELPQAKAIADFPILIRKIGPGSKSLPPNSIINNERCLAGLRVLELSRVIAAPVAGRTLAAHGADVLWVTSPNLPDLPTLDIDTSRGKRSAQLDLTEEPDREKLRTLAKDADVFIQGYRPGSIAAKGFSASDVAAMNPGVVYASLSAYGTEGLWAGNRGFDSIVQTCSGMNISEAEHFGAGEAARPMPCQALDHASGYFLATGINAALYKKSMEGGSWEVNVSLAGTMKYIRSLGQYPETEGFIGKMPQNSRDVEEYLETRMSQFGELKAVRHSARVEGLKVGWERMPKKLGSDKAEWI